MPAPTVHRSYQEARLPPGSALAIGNFDGVHLGHQQLIALAAQFARGAGGEVAVFTFDPHPARVLAPKFAPRLLCTVERRIELLGETGVQRVVAQPFTREFSQRSAESFVNDVLIEGLGAAAVVVGYDFSFGKGRAGNLDTLREVCGPRGVEVLVLPPAYAQGLLASSTKIREFILAGRVAGAARLLGRPFELSGEVVRGAGRGRGLGFPTANIQAVQEIRPANGIYAAWARVAGEPERVAAAVSIGTIPTFTTDDAVTIEAYLLDFERDLYGQRLVLELVRHLRAERRFEGAQALVEQIERDVAATRELLRGAP